MHCIVTVFILIVKGRKKYFPRDSYPSHRFLTFLPTLAPFVKRERLPICIFPFIYNQQEALSYTSRFYFYFLFYDFLFSFKCIKI